MNKKLSLLIGLFVFFASAKVMFAANVAVQGTISNQDIATFGSKIIFTDTTTHTVVLTQPIDPSGNYTALIPAGTYDVAVVPPEKSGLSTMIKHNEKITTAAVENFTLPSAAQSESLSRGIQKSPFPVMIYGGGAIGVVALGVIIGYLVKKNMT